ncbi:MAG: hypothetical protein ACW986_11060 [Promethearchaeota archaeon]|jgi:hypothetical protein
MGKKDKKRRESTTRSSRSGWDKTEAKEELIADALKRKDMDIGKVELVDRDSATPVIETYDEDTGQLEGSILLRNGNREGLLALVKIIEDVEVKQDHDANVGSFSFGGKISIENPSNTDRLWDIDVALSSIGSTDLKSSDVAIRELGTESPDNVESIEFHLKQEVQNLFLVKEFISTLTNADDVLNINDIERELLKLKDKTGKASKKSVPDEPTVEDDDEEEEDEEEEETWEDGGTITETSLETFGISIDKDNTITFAIALRNMFDKPVSNIKVVKTIPEDFTNPIVRDTTEGRTEIEGDKIIWTIDSLRPEYTVLCKFTCNIMVTDIARRKTGAVDVTYQAASSFAEGLAIDKFDAYTRNKFYIETLERDAEPNIWDNKLIFDNTSEFVIQLFNADVYSPEDETTKFVDIDPNDVPMLPSGAQWHSIKWEYENEDYPTFRKKLEFRVVPDYQYKVTVAVSISDVILEIASISGDMSYDKTETPTYKTQDVVASLKMANNGSAPLNEITVVQQSFTDEYQAPKADEIQLIWDGDEVEISGDAVIHEGNVFKISLTNLKDTSTGMFKPDSTLEFKYPVHCVNPVRDSTFESEIVYYANTFPVSQELEFRPEVPVIEALHIRRKFRIGKEVLPIGSLGNYKIILTLENIGESTLHNLTLLDKVPDSFEYGDYSTTPKITDEVGQDTLKWTIDALEVGDKVEISYEITGTGEYSPSDAQLAL